VLENTGAGEWNRTTDLRFTSQDRTVFKMLGASNGFPVLIVEARTWLLSSESTDSRSIDGVWRVLAQI
jgi:hypothetical protein